MPPPSAASASKPSSKTKESEAPPSTINALQRLCKAKDHKIETLKTAVEERQEVIFMLRRQIAKLQKEKEEWKTADKTNTTTATTRGSKNKRSRDDTTRKDTDTGCQSSNQKPQSKKMKQLIQKRKDTWELRLQQIKEYKEEHGHCNVPHRYKGNPQLGPWVSSQRRFYRNTISDTTTSSTTGTDPPKLTVEQILKLQKVGFEWEPTTNKAKLNTIWEKRFRELLRFQVVHSHCRVPKRYKANPKLGNWVHDNRKNYISWKTGKGRGRKGLTDERIQELEDIGFEWTVPMYNRKE